MVHFHHLQLYNYLFVPNIYSKTFTQVLASYSRIVSNTISNNINIHCHSSYPVTYLRFTTYCNYNLRGSYSSCNAGIAHTRALAFI